MKRRRVRAWCGPVPAAVVDRYAHGCGRAHAQAPFRSGAPAHLVPLHQEPRCVVIAAVVCGSHRRRLHGCRARCARRAPVLRVLRVLPSNQGGWQLPAGRSCFWEGTARRRLNWGRSHDQPRPAAKDFQAGGAGRRQLRLGRQGTRRQRAAADYARCETPRCEWSTPPFVASAQCSSCTCSRNTASTHGAQGARHSGEGGGAGADAGQGHVALMATRSFPSPGWAQTLSSRPVWSERRPPRTARLEKGR